MYIVLSCLRTLFCWRWRGHHPMDFGVEAVITPQDAEEAIRWNFDFGTIRRVVNTVHLRKLSTLAYNKEYTSVNYSTLV